MTTEKLHLNDSWQFEFNARLRAISTYHKQPSLVLDRSAFYGESGGQLGDQGTLEIAGEKVNVVDTQLDEDGHHHHLVAQIPAAAEPGLAVTAQVDVNHRRDMMSQHSGQHLLSAICWRELQAKTISSRLGSSDSTIDIDLAEITPQQLTHLEDVANQLVMDARPMRIHYPDQAALAAMKLRRTPKVTDNIRIIEIADYDFTPCGGTHCDNTGQIGPIAIVSSERYKGGTRLHFVAGMRAIQHMRTMHQRLDNLGESLGCGLAGVEESVTKLQHELRTRSQEAGELRANLADMLTDQLLADHPPRDTGGTPIIVVREKDDLASLRTLAERLSKRPDVVALVAGIDPKSGDWRLVLMAGGASGFHAGQWFRGPGQAVGARGGGRPERAEGRLPADQDPRTLTLIEDT